MTTIRTHHKNSGNLHCRAVADLSSRLKAACGSTDVIIVDMTATRFCDDAG